MSQSTERYVVVELQNGSRCGLVTGEENWEDEVDGIPWVDAPVINWGEYISFLMEEERTEIRDVREYAWNDAELAEAVARGDVRVYDETGGYVSLSDDEDMRKVMEFGGLAAWSTRYGIELP